jgi:hypothetical protein
MRKHLLILGAASVLALASGTWAKPQLTTDMAHGINFAEYKTFTWASTHPQGGINSVQYQRIIADISSRLGAKGYSHNTPDHHGADARQSRRSISIRGTIRLHDSYTYNEGHFA